VCPSWSFRSRLLGTIYDTLYPIIFNEFYAKAFLSNRSPPQLVWIKQSLVLTFRNAVQEAQIFLKVAEICSYVVRYSRCEWGLTPYSHIAVPYVVTAQAKWRCSYVFSTSVHTLTKSTTHGVELWPIIIRLILVCSDLYLFGYYLQICHNILCKRCDINVID